MGRKHRSRALSPTHNPSGEPAERTLGGGTDWFVRHPDPETDQEIDFTDREKKLRSIHLAGSILEIGAATTVREFFANTEVRTLARGRGHSAGIEGYEADVASPTIRARATLAGNIANASPVADMTAMLFVLDARLRLGVRPGSEPEGSTKPEALHREIALTDFFIGYKKTAARAEERIEAILLPDAGISRLFSFEKAARRARLDIAAVNTAFSCRLANGDGSGKNHGGGKQKTATSKAFTREDPPVLRDVRLSAGGVGPTPLLLKEASAYLEGKPVTAPNVRECARLAVSGTKPISDARGTAAYRSDILERLVMAHFLKLFPELSLEEELFA
jgi:xanthine dehydrogenase small subunit